LAGAALADRGRDGEEDGGARVRELRVERIAMAPQEREDVVATEAEMPPFGAVVRDLPSVRPVMDRLEVDLAESREVLRRVDEGPWRGTNACRRDLRGGTSPLAAGQRRASSGSHRSPRST